MNSDDLTKLIKCLNLTTSSSDGEALNAIRAANRLLAKGNMRWEKVFSFRPQEQQRRQQHDQQHREWKRRADERARQEEPPDVDAMFAMVRSRVLQPNSNKFIESLFEQWNTKGYLTEKQRAALEKFYAHAKNSRKR